MKWKKQNGKIIETNDLPATINAAAAAGWIPVKAPAKKAAKKK